MKKVCLLVILVCVFMPGILFAQNSSRAAQKQKVDPVSKPVTTQTAKSKISPDRRTNQKNVLRDSLSAGLNQRTNVDENPGAPGGSASCELYDAGSISISSQTGNGCPGSNSISFQHTPGLGYGGTIQWQSAQDGATHWSSVGNGGLSYTATNLTQNTRFRLMKNDGLCTDFTSEILITISLPNLVINNPAPVCAPSTVNLTAAAITAGSEPNLYYAYGDASAILSNPAATSVSGTYYVSAYRDAAMLGCNSVKPVIVTINTPVAWVQDFDQDGYYTGVGLLLCPSLIPLGIGWVIQTTQHPGDCDDFNANAHPGATEVCDNIDNNCNGQTDENGNNVYFLDFDGDGFGNPNISVPACSKPQGYSNNNTDCNDNAALINPNTVWIIDSDQDGYYSGNPIVQCASPGAGYIIKTTQQSGDCNDSDPAIHGPLPFYLDKDDDGYGAGPVAMLCSPGAPEGYSTTNDDCNDADDSMYPGAPELCDGKDNNCNGQTDEGVKTIFYMDFDNDGFGNSGASILDCTAPAGYTSTNGDCNDNNSAVNPDAMEQCGNGIDDDCDGLVDEGCGKLPGIFISSTVIIEGNQGTRQANFILRLNKKNSSAVTVKYETVNGSAIVPQDYIAKNGIITFPPNTLLQTLKVDVIGDMMNEANETFKLKLSQPVNANLINTNATCLILNDDPLPQVSIKDTTVNESQGVAKVRIVLAAPSGQTIKLRCSTRNNTAISPYDYTGQTNVLLTFAPGVTSMYAAIPVIRDNINEPTEYFKVRLMSADNAVINSAARKAKVTIINTPPANNHKIESGDEEKEKQIIVQQKKSQLPGLNVKAWPNPSTAYFSIEIQSSDLPTASIKVYDVQGRQVWALDKVQPNSITRIGDGWKGGVYFVAIIQGDQRKTIKLIKEN